MVNYLKKTVTIQGIKISYFETSRRSFRKVVLFSGGFDLAEDLLKRSLSHLYLVGFQVVAFDYPGRGNSEASCDNRLNTISDISLGFLKSLNSDFLVLMGASYGGDVIGEILKKEPQNIKGFFIVGAGECFNVFYRDLIRLLAFPFKYFRFTKKYYLKVLRKAAVFRKVNDKNIENIGLQALSILEYRIKFEKPVRQEGLIVSLENDKVVNRRSLLKFRDMYPKAKLVSIEGGHAYNLLAKYKMTKIKIYDLMNSYLKEMRQEKDLKSKEFIERKI